MSGRKPRPDDVRCQGIYGEKYRVEALRGTQCVQPVDPAVGYCGMHKEIPEDRRCHGKGKPHYAMKNQSLCGIHGGKAPHMLAAAERRGAEAELEVKVSKVLAKLDVAPVDNPLVALSQLAGQVVAWQDALAERVNSLTEIRYEDAKGAEQLRAEVSLYERAMDRCNTVLGNIGRLNIDERLARVTEKQAETIIKAIDAGLLAAGITGEQAIQVKTTVAKRLRAA